MTQIASYKLIHKETGAELKPGDTTKTFRGEAVTIDRFEAPTHPGSTGRVYIRNPDGSTAYPGYYPSVIGAVITPTIDPAFPHQFTPDTLTKTVSTCEDCGKAKDDPVHTGYTTITDWLVTNLGSHDIAAYDDCAADFKIATGHDFIKAPRYTAAQIRRAICESEAALLELPSVVAAVSARGLGGFYNGDADACNGWEVAEALAETYAPGFQRDARIYGRGSRYRAALEALRKAGF